MTSLSQQRRDKNEQSNIKFWLAFLIVTIAVGVFVASLTSRVMLYQSNHTEDTATHILINTTAYSEYDSCHYKGCPTASGIKAYIGGIACPRHWELGTEVLIQGERYTCEDRYNADLSDRLDLFLGFGQQAYTEAKEYGVQPLLVTILN